MKNSEEKAKASIAAQQIERSRERLNITAIKERWSRHFLAPNDIDAMIAEIERLRSALLSATD